MNREQVDARNTAAIARYARNLADTGGRAPRALLDELWSITVAFAAEQVAQHATPAPIVIAASTESVTAAEVVTPRSSARTRTRTRGNSG